MSEQPNDPSGDTAAQAARNRKRRATSVSGHRAHSAPAIGEERFLAVFRTAQSRREQRLAEARANFTSDVSDAEAAYAREIADGLFPGGIA